jgi:hypothetical protein
MADPILVACLVALRTEFNVLAPGRDKGADGWIGDAAHQQESSDHNPDETGRTPYEDADNINEVHALDIDKDLGGGLDLDTYVERIRLAHERGDDDRLQNIIWRGRIASRSWGWTWRAYTGPSQHFDHAHFSARYTTAQENDTSPWGVYQEDDMDAAEMLTALTNALQNPDTGFGFEMRRIAWRYPISSSRTALATLDGCFALLQQILAKVTGDDAEAQRIIDAIKVESANLQTAIGDVDEQVFAKLGDPTTPDEQVAAALKSLLGDRKDAVLALMQG